MSPPLLSLSRPVTEDVIINTVAAGTLIENIIVRVHTLSCRHMFKKKEVDSQHSPACTCPNTSLSTFGTVIGRHHLSRYYVVSTTILIVTVIVTLVVVENVTLILTLLVIHTTLDTSPPSLYLSYIPDTSPPSLHLSYISESSPPSFYLSYKPDTSPPSLHLSYIPDTSPPTLY